MKDKCDNICETCGMATQIHCILVFSRATNESVGALAERIENLETKDGHPVMLNPLKNSVNPPTQELEE